jgi:prefoldin subunit 5
MKIETVKEEKVEQQYQSRSSLSNPPDPKPQITWDPDSDDNWDRNLLKRVMDQRRLNIHELQLIENGKRELEEERQQIELMRQSVRQEINDLKAREDKLNEIESLLPSVRELQNAGITFDLVLPYMMAINEKSALENIDLKTAAYNMMRDFREYRTLGGLRRVIENAEKQLAALGSLIREKQQAIVTLRYLQRAGFSKKDVIELVALVRMWSQGNDISSSRKLDTELLGNNGNLQQPGNNGSSNPGSNSSPPLVNGNGINGGFSMQDWIKLNLRALHPTC